MLPESAYENFVFIGKFKIAVSFIVKAPKIKMYLHMISFISRFYFCESIFITSFTYVTKCTNNCTKNGERIKKITNGFGNKVYNIQRNNIIFNCFLIKITMLLFHISSCEFRFAFHIHYNN